MHDDRPGGIRRVIHDLPPSKIGEVAYTAFGDASVIPLWFGEGDLPTPDFICEDAAAALRRGETFYTWKRGIPRCARRSRNISRGSTAWRSPPSG